MARAVRGLSQPGPDGTIRVLLTDPVGSFIDLPSESVVWRPDPEDLRARTWLVPDHVVGLAGRLDDRFTELFTGPPPAGPDGKDPKPQATTRPHCQPTVPMPVCLESRHGPCVPVRTADRGIHRSPQAG